MTTPNFIKNLQKKRCNYNHPDQATSQANSLVLLSSGIYTEEERFVFELLQNAVDAHYDESQLLDIKMVIKDGYFVFMHNGEAFSERDIEGLCDVGNGNKMKDVKKIGYKGIGFKSVFMRSTNVTVSSGGYCFRFDKSYWDNFWDENWDNTEYGEKDKDKKYLMPWQIIPIESIPPIEFESDQFNVYTYIKIDETDSLEQKILKLLSSSQFLLFLMSKNIRMTFESKGQIKCWIEKSEINNQVILSTNGKEESKWLIHTNKDVKVPSNLKVKINADINTPDKLKGVESFDLSFAIALDEKGKLKPLEKAVVYTYLPTSFCFGEEGFPFLVNANFITDAGRQQLHKDSEWNKLIFSEIPSEFLTWMKELSTCYKNYWEVLPHKSYGSGNSLEIIYENKMEEAINEIAFIPSLQDPNQKVLASEAFMDRMEIADAISINALVDHINRTFSRSFGKGNQINNIWKGSKILSSYGVFIFDKQKLKGLFEDQKAFENISPELDIRLINYLYGYYTQNKTEQSELTCILQSTRFLLDDNNSLSFPNDLFFPSSYKEQNELAEDAKILHGEIYETIKSQKPLIDWLTLLGVESLSDATFIKNVICKSGYITKDNAIEVADFIFDTSQRFNIFDEVGDYYLSKLLFLSKRGNLHSAEELYLGSKFNPETDIEPFYSGDIFISDDYGIEKNLLDYSIFLMKLGISGTIQMRYRKVTNSSIYSRFPILVSAISNSKKMYWTSWLNGQDYYFNFEYYELFYIPFVGLNEQDDYSLAKLVWTKILKQEVQYKDDYLKGNSGLYKRTLELKEYDGNVSFLDYCVKNKQRFPTTDGQQLTRDMVFLNTEDIKLIGGDYLPIINVDCEIHDSWKSLLNLRDSISINDCLTILTKVSQDTGNIEKNKERITKIYNRLIELDALSENNKDKIIVWSSSNLILSKENEFVSPSNLRHITLDGFSSKNRVYIGNPSNKEKVIELLALMGVKIYTPQSINAEFEDKEESENLKCILRGKISALALLASGEETDKTNYDNNRSQMSSLIEKTHFYHCTKIKLTYGNSDDVMEKHTFGNRNDFYYIGDLRPSNIEPLLEPLCRYLSIKGKERELFIMFFENLDGIKQNLKDKGYDVSYIEDEHVDVSGNINVSLDYHPDVSMQDRNTITGYKGEIIVYEKLLSMGYKPICPSISTKNNYEKKVVVHGKTYYCKPNYNSEWDISFVTENGHEILLEVKSTTTNVGSIENMPISSREWSMIKKCDKEKGKSYIIVRVFGIDSPQQDIYLFKSHLLEENI